MVGNSADRDIGSCILAIFFTRNLTNLIDNITDGINLEHIINILHYAGKAFKAHSGINILMFKLGIGTVTHIIELRENVIPDFHITVTVATGFTIGTAAAVFFAAVEINLTTRAAGTCSVFPEVICLAEANNMLLRHADFIAPDGISFFITLVNRGPQKVCGDFEGFS